MGKICLGILCLAVVLACPGIGPNPPTTTTTISDPTRGMICQDYYDNGRCDNGEYMHMCLNESLTRCGYVVNNRMYECADCDPVDCDSAAQRAVRACWSSLGATGLQSYTFSEMQQLEDWAVRDLLEATEEFHLTY